MNNIDDPEKNAKVPDSAYSNSCSNSQSRRSHSSKSTHSGSNSSGSSGYGGKQSTSSSCNDLPKKDTEAKKKKQTQVEKLKADNKIKGDSRHQKATAKLPITEEGGGNVLRAESSTNYQAGNGEENMDICNPDDSNSNNDEDGFSCVISMYDGVVMYTTSSITTALGFPKDMWIGRSFIDFVHPRDRNTFASQITNGFAVPKIMLSTQDKALTINSQGSSMVCRIRRYRGLNLRFGIRRSSVAYMPFLLKFFFKSISNQEGESLIYLVIQTTPYFSAFKIPREILTTVASFVMRHNAQGILEYIDSESVPYIGFLPQDIVNKDALQLYHPGDFEYLYQVYESLIKEGVVTRSNPCRVITQNGHYVKVETEWSAFINPWSRKLEFINGKHKVVEGPVNPDVFQNATAKSTPKFTDEEKNKANMYKDRIITIMNDVLTKPAELAKQQMSKRCQELALYMENVMADQPKGEEELRLEIQEMDNNYFERDSVMLGGISPHHDYDSKSSIETPLSYNQLNYNDNLQRYFNSHHMDVPTASNVATANSSMLAEAESSTSKDPSAAIAKLIDSDDLISCGESNAQVKQVQPNPSAQGQSYQQVRLTESLLTKHNAEMAKELMKIHRENRSNNKGDREKVGNEVRQKKKEHLARCNATFQSTANDTNNIEPMSKKPQGVKRPKHIEPEVEDHKHHCNASRQMRRKQNLTPDSESFPTAIASTEPAWSANSINNMNSLMFGMSVSPQVPIMSSVATVPSVYPMYITPTTTDFIQPELTVLHNTNSQQFPPPPVPYMMYGQPVYGSPFVYSPLNPPNNYMPQTLMSHSMQATSGLSPLCLTISNYEEACRASVLPRTTRIRRDKKRVQARVDKIETPIVDAACELQNSDSTKQLNNDGNPPPAQYASEVACSVNSLTVQRAPCDSSTATEMKSAEKSRTGDETVYRTDGESSYSSFYSSFFKTESGSNEESIDPKKVGGKNSMPAPKAINRLGPMKAPKRKMQPPWMDQVCATPEFIYKYQLPDKTMEEVLSADKKKIKTFEQPSLVNEQLGQLYLDLQLEGVAARLTLEEGITSSGSSADDVSTASKGAHNKREYSKLVMIYEENAPLPSPPNPTATVSENSVS